MRKQKGFEIQFGSIFYRFVSYHGRPKRSQDARKSMASKFEQFLKAFWNTIFSTKRRRESRHSPIFKWARRVAQVAWGGLRTGKTDVQTPRTFESGTWSKEISLRTRRPGSNGLARRARLGGGSLRAFRRA